MRTDTDEPYYGEVPIGAHIWVQDPSNPQYGWDYIREQNTYSYFPHIITNEYSFEFGGKLYGVRIYEYTNGYKVAQIQELGKRFAEAALLARVSTKNLDVILTGVKLIENPTYDNAVDFIKDIFLKNIL